MKLTKSEAKYLIESPKRLIDIHTWKVVDNRCGCSVTHSFKSRIEIDGTLPRGIWFRCVKIYGRESDCTFQLDQEQIKIRSHIPLYRLDWKPSRAHVNGKCGPEELRGILIPSLTTHEHICLDNCDDETGFIRFEGLKTARIIEPDFQTFIEALRYVCDKLNIQNWDEIPPPIVQGDNLL